MMVSRLFPVASLLAVLASPVLAATTPPVVTSGSSADGSVSWTTGTNSTLHPVGAYSPTMYNPGFSNATSSSTPFGTGVNAVTISTVSSDDFGSGNNNSGYTNVYAPDGTLLNGQSFYFSESKSKSVGGYLNRP